MAANKTKGILKRMSDMQLVVDKKDKGVGVDMVEESHHRFSTSKKATVEVTVKVKKRHHSPRSHHQHPDRDDKHHDHDKQQQQLENLNKSRIEVFPKGSYGDLLAKGKPISGNEIVAKEWKGVGNKSGDVGEKIKCCNEGGDHPKSVCHKIPITSDLYLETHTHVVRSSSKSSTPAATAITPRGQQEYHEKQQPRKNLKTRGERERGSSGGGSNKATKQSSPQYKKKESSPYELYEKHRHVQDERRYHHGGYDAGDGLRQGTTRNIGVGGGDIDITEAEMEKYVKLRLENEVLRKQATGLLAEMQKSKKEQQESIMTITELVQLADILKQENNQLIRAREEQQNLQQKLVSAVYENQELKQYLESVMEKQKDSSVRKDIHMNQLEKMRTVIQEVKSTIQEEIKGIATSDSESMAYRETLRGLDFNISEGGSALLNDSNASEVQRILGSYEDSQIHTLKSLEGLDEIRQLNSSIQEEIQRITSDSHNDDTNT